MEGGPKLVEIAGDRLRGANFFLLDAVEGPRRPRNHRDLREFDGAANIVILPMLDGIRLRGEFVCLDDDPDTSVMFLGHPWLTDLSDVGEFGLDIRDFPAHTGLSDMLVNLQMREAVNQDLKRLAGRLRDRTAELERELENNHRLEEQLRQAQKMEALGRLAGGVAHDFNNALTAISGHASLGLLGKNLDDARRHLQSINEASNRATGITARLLAFARRKRMEVREVEAGPALEEVSNLLAPILGERAILEVSYPPDLGAVSTDASALQQAIVNLVVNARDASPSGGRIELTARKERSDVAIPMHGSEREAGEWVVITVRDFGAGIEEAVMERLFEPFFTTKELGEGTGLGLTTVWWVAERSSGAIDVQSTVGEGTTISMHLPAVPSAEFVARPSEIQNIGRGRRLLLVDDDDAVRTSTMDLLRATGWEVFGANSAEEALALVDSIGPIEVLVSDIVLSGMGGRELASTLRLRQPWIRVVLISGYTAEIEAAQGDLQSADVMVLGKPFTLRELQDVLVTE